MKEGKLRSALYLSHIAVFFFYFFSVGLFTSMLSVYLAGLALRPTEISMIASAAGIFTMALQPVAGMIYDATGRGRLVSTVLLCGSAVCGIAFSASRSVPALFLLCGLATGLLNSVNPYCERLASHSRYRYGVLRSWGGIGGAIAPQFSGIIFERLDPRANFALFAIGAVLTAVFLNRIREPEAPKTRAREGQGGRFFSRPYALFLAVSFLFNGVTTAGRTYIPLLLRENMDGASSVGAVLLGATLMELPVILFSDRFMDRFSARGLILADLALTAAEYAVYCFAKSPAAICAAALLTKSVTTMLFIMITLKAVLDIVGENRSLTALSLAATVSSMGGVAFTWLAGVADDRMGIRFAFGMLLGGLLLSVLFACLIRIPKKESDYFSGAAKTESRTGEDG